MDEVIAAGRDLVQHFALAFEFKRRLIPEVQAGTSPENKHHA